MGDGPDNIVLLYLRGIDRAAVHLERGDHQRATEAATRAGRAGTESDIPRLHQTGILAHALTLARRPLDAIELLQTVTLASKRRNAFTGQRDVLYLGVAYGGAERLDDRSTIAA